jgi:hypothetical protein
MENVHNDEKLRNTLSKIILHEKIVDSFFLYQMGVELSKKTFHATVPLSNLLYGGKEMAGKREGGRGGNRGVKWRKGRGKSATIRWRIEGSV